MYPAWGRGVEVEIFFSVMIHDRMTEKNELYPARIEKAISEDAVRRRNRYTT